MIEITDIHKTYRMGEVEVHALRGVSLKMEQGEFTAIVGPSGSGKSTLMHILGLLDVPTSGTYRLEGRDVSNLSGNELAAQRATSIGFVFQQFNLLPRMSARENVAIPLIYSNHPAPASPDELLDRVGLGDRKDHAPNELSGGQQQRVAIARALVNGPAVVMADEPTGNLDSASSAEIMRVLQDLNRSGLTVIVVTHDPEVAASAGRIVTMRDGCIVDDTGVKAARGESVAGESDKVRAGGRSPGRSVLFAAVVEASAMFRQAVRALAANKTRAFLSMLGVMVGVAAVIAVLALGTGAKMAVEDRLSSMGANLLVLRPGGSRSRGVAMGAGAVSRLTLQDAEALSKAVPTAAAVVPTVRGSAQITHEGKNWRTTVMGVTPEYADMHNMKPEFGRFISAEDVKSRARVAVMGLTVSSELFGTASPIGQTVRINRSAFEVVGVLPKKGSTFFQDENDQIVVPVTTAMRRLLGKDYVDSIEIQAESAGQLDYTELASTDFIKKLHRVEPDNEEAFTVRNMADIQSTIEATSRTMTLLLAGIGAVSLLVGGIGIMNIMLVSVTERTREIGIRKAVGARGTDILMQFLIESLVVSAFGGIVGIGLGWGIAVAMSKFAGWTVAVTPKSVLTAFAFSVAVGIVFGLWPAQKASALEPIDALRYE